MGQAKRRKELGLMPEQSKKPRMAARIKTDPMDDMYGVDGMAMILGSLLMSRHSGQNFAMRNQLARLNRESEESA